MNIQHETKMGPILNDNKQVDSESSDNDFRVEEHDSEHLTASDTPESGVSNSGQEASFRNMAEIETKALHRSKVAAVALLAVTAVLAAGLAYYFSRKAETMDFERQVRTLYECASLSAHLSHLASANQLASFLASSISLLVA
jgi:hypothetical protein